MANLPRSKKQFDNPYEVSLSDTQLESLKTWISDRVNAMLVEHSDRDKKILTWRNLYEGATWERTLPWENASNLHIPMIGWIVDALHVRMVQSHFGVEPYVRVKPQEIEDTDNSSIIERGLWHVHQKQNKLYSGYLAILDSLIAGYGVVKTPWKQDYQLIKKGKDRKFALRSEYPGCEYIPAESFYMYPFNSSSVDDAQIVGHRFYRRYDDLMRGVAIGIYNEKWVRKLENKAVPETQTETREAVLTAGAAHGLDWKDMKYELYELLVRYDLDEDGLEEDYLVVYDKTTDNIIRWIEYPYEYGEKYYHTYTPFPNGQIYGYSVVDMLEPMEHELSTLHNQRIDNNSIVNMPIFTVMNGSPAAKDDQKWYPGKKIPVNDHDEVKQLTMIPPSNGFAQDEERIMQYAKLRSGTSDLTFGQTVKGDKTAYEIEAALAEGSIKIRLVVQLGTKWLSRMAWHEIAMMRQFMSSEDFLRITGAAYNPLEDMDIEDLWKSFDFEPVGNTTTSNRELERQKFVFLRESMKDDPLMFDIDPMTGKPKSLDRFWSLDKDFLMAHGIQDYVTYIGTKPEPTPLAPPVPEQPVQPPMGGEPSPEQLVQQAVMEATGVPI